MTIARRVAWNTAAQSAARIGALALSLLTNYLLTRHLGVSGYGVFVTVTVYATFFGSVFDLGISQFVARELASGAATERLFQEGLGLRIALAVPIALLALGVALLLYNGPHDADLRRGIALALPVVALMGIVSVATALFQARLLMDRVALGEICGQVIAAAGIVAAVVADLGVLTVIAAYVVGFAINAAVVLVLARRLAPLAPAIDPQAWRRLLHRALPLGIAVMVATIYFRADAILLSVLKGSHAV